MSRPRWLTQLIRHLPDLVTTASDLLSRKRPRQDRRREASDPAAQTPPPPEHRQEQGPAPPDGFGRGEG